MFAWDRYEQPRDNKGVYSYLFAFCIVVHGFSKMHLIQPCASLDPLKMYRPFPKRSMCPLAITYFKKGKNLGKNLEG